MIDLGSYRPLIPNEVYCYSQDGADCIILLNRFKTKTLPELLNLIHDKAVQLDPGKRIEVVGFEPVRTPLENMLMAIEGVRDALARRDEQCIEYLATQLRALGIQPHTNQYLMIKQGFFPNGAINSSDQPGYAEQMKNPHLTAKIRLEFGTLPKEKLIEYMILEGPPCNHPARQISPDEYSTGEAYPLISLLDIKLESHQKNR